MRAYVLITTKPGSSEQVAQFLKSIQGVIQADSVYGRYDVIAILEAPDLRALAELIYTKIAKEPNIIHTETAITLG